MNRLLSFESFIVAVEAGSISAAAERLGTTKSNISRRIAELEAHLGVRLLNRNPRRLSTTDVGGEFYEQIQRLLGEMREAEDRVADKRATPRGVLRVSVPMSFSTLHFNSLAAKLMRNYPELILELDCDDRVVDLQTQGHDCAVRIGRLQDSSLIARAIATNNHFICGSPDYLERRGVPVTVEDLRDHDGLHYNLREPHGMWHLAAEEQMGTYRVHCRMRSNNGEALQEAALAGLGLAILPTFMVSAHLKSGSLRIVLPQYTLPGGSISVVYVRNKQPSLKLRVLIEAMLEAFSPVPIWDREIAHLLPKR